MGANSPEREVIGAEGIYGAETRQPLVHIRFRRQHITITPDEARAFAANLLQCAEAADQDAFIVEFFERELDVPFPHAVGVLRQFRTARITRNAHLHEEGGERGDADRH